MFITMIQNSARPTLDRDGPLSSPSPRSCTTSMWKISLSAVWMRKAPPASTMRLCPVKLACRKGISIPKSGPWKASISMQHHEEQHDAHADGEDHAELADPLLILGRHLLGFDGNVEEIVEAEHGLQRGQHQERHQVLDGEEIGHATAPRDSVP